MSKAELEIMKKTGKVVEGAEGLTFVSTKGMKDYMGAARRGYVYVEFDVHVKSLI